MAISCDHPRPKLNLPGYTPARLLWQPPSFIPADNPRELARAVLESFRGIAEDMQRLGRTRVTVPLVEDIDARDGQVILGVGDGQVIKLPEPNPSGELGKVTVILTDVVNPVQVVHPDGTALVLSEEGVYDFATGQGQGVWETTPGAVGGIRGVSVGTVVLSTGSMRFDATSIGLGADSITNNLSVLSTNNVLFGLSGSVLTAQAVVRMGDSLSAFFATRFDFINSNGMVWALSTSTLAGQGRIVRVGANYAAIRGMSVEGGAILSAGSIQLSRSRLFHPSGQNAQSDLANLLIPNVIFGQTGSTISGQAVFFVRAGVTNVGFLGTALSFENSNGVSWGQFTTTRGGEGQYNCITASVEPGVSAIAVPGTTVSSGVVVFSNSNGVSFGLNGQTMTASVGAGGAAGSIAVPGTTFALGQLVFSNSNNLSFGINGSTLTAQFAGAAIAGGTQTATSGTVVFSNSNGFTFGMSGSTRVTASFDAIKSISAGTTRLTNGEAVFSNSNGVSFGVNGNIITASVAGGAAGSLSGGTTRASLGEIVFSNSNGVSFGLNGQTMTASVGAGGAAGSIAVSGTTFALGQLGFSRESIALGAATLSNNTAVMIMPNVMFGIAGSTMTAQAVMGLEAAGSLTLGSGLSFSNANNMVFGFLTSLIGGEGRWIRLTASCNPTASSENIIAAGTQNATPGTVLFSNENGFSFGMSGSSRVTLQQLGPKVWWNREPNSPGLEGGGFSLQQSNGILSLFPLAGPGMNFPGPMLASELGLLMTGAVGNTSMTGSFSSSMRGGLYTMVNSTQLSLLNSFSSTWSATTQATSARSSQLAGRRWWAIRSSQWSSAPNLTFGVYWLGILVGQSGQTNHNSIQAVNVPAQGFVTAEFRGYMGTGINLTSARSIMGWPFWGWMSTAGIPNSIGQSQLIGKNTSNTVHYPTTPLVAIVDGGINLTC